MMRATGGTARASANGRARLATAVALAVAVLAGGCGGSKAGGTAANDRTQPTASSQHFSTGLTLWAPADRPHLPRLAGRTLNGDRLDLSSWRGHVLVVNTWGSWCGPCRKEAPDLARVSTETAGAGVRFVGVDTRDNDSAARAFVRRFRITYPSLVDQAGRLTLTLGRTIPLAAVPSTVVVDSRGRVAARVIGAVTYSTLRGLVDDTLAETSPSPR